MILSAWLASDSYNQVIFSFIIIIIIAAIVNHLMWVILPTDCYIDKRVYHNKLYLYFTSTTEPLGWEQRERIEWTG